MYSFSMAGSFQFNFLGTLPSAHFVYRLPCYSRLSIFNRVSNLIDLVLYVFFLFFRYMLANLFWAFLSFETWVLVGFFLLHLEAVFTSARFSLTANISHGTLGLVLCLVGVHSAVSEWALAKFSYSSFGVCVSVFSCSASNLFLSAKAYLSLISLLLRWVQS